MLPVVAEVSAPAVTVKVYVPDVFRIRLLNVATPFTAFAVSVLPEVKPPGPLFTAIVTAEVFDVTKLAWASRGVTPKAFNACHLALRQW